MKSIVNRIVTLFCKYRDCKQFSTDDLIRLQNDEFRQINKMHQNVALMSRSSVRLHIPQMFNGIFLQDGFHFAEHRSIHNISWNNLFASNNGAVIISSEASALGVDVLSSVLGKISRTNKFANKFNSSGIVTHNMISFYWEIDRYDLQHGKGFIKPSETEFMDISNTLVMRVYI